LYLAVGSDLDVKSSYFQMVQTGQRSV
jgi:hypothetical protein